MDSLRFLGIIVLIISVSVPTAFSDRSLESLAEIHGVTVNAASGGGGGGGGGGDADTMPCIQKLMPCQPYLHVPNPPLTCCAPLKEILEKDVMCLCSVFNNPEMLKSLNLTKENALDLPKACGANADISICDKAETPPSGSPPSLKTPPASSNDSSSSGNTPSTKNTAAAVSFTGLSFVTAFVAAVLVLMY